METYQFQKSSFQYEGKLDLKDSLKIKNKKEKVIIYIVDDFIQREFIQIQLRKLYNKLIQMLKFYLDSDDDTGIAYQEMLNEIEKFRVIMKTKKQFLFDQDILKMEKQKKQK